MAKMINENPRYQIIELLNPLILLLKMIQMMMLSIAEKIQATGAVIVAMQLTAIRERCLE